MWKITKYLLNKHAQFCTKMLHIKNNWNLFLALKCFMYNCRHKDKQYKGNKNFKKKQASPWWGQGPYSISALYVGFFVSLIISAQKLEKSFVLLSHRSPSNSFWEMYSSYQVFPWNSSFPFSKYVTWMTVVFFVDMQHPQSLREPILLVQKDRKNN